MEASTIMNAYITGGSRKSDNLLRFEIELFHVHGVKNTFCNKFSYFVSVKNKSCLKCCRHSILFLMISSTLIFSFNFIELSSGP